MPIEPSAAPTSPPADQLLTEIQRAKEAYLVALRQAFVDGLDPRLLVQRGILNRAFNQPSDSGSQMIDLTEPPFDLREDTAGSTGDVGRVLNIQQTIGDYLG